MSPQADEAFIGQSRQIASKKPRQIPENLTLGKSRDLTKLS